MENVDSFEQMFSCGATEVGAVTLSLSSSIKNNHHDIGSQNVEITRERRELSILDLPREILIEVFKYVPQYELITSIGLVCRLWRRLVLAAVLGRRLALKMGTPTEICIKLFSERPLLQVLRCSALKCLSEVTAQFSDFSQLQCLDIGFCVLDSAQALFLAAHLPPTLRHLNVEGCDFVNADFMQVVVLRCSFLEALNLSHCLSMTDTGILIVANGLPCLHTLNIDGIQWLTDMSLDAIESSAACEHRRIRHLRLDGFEFTVDGLSRLLPFLSELQTLSISFAEKLSDSILDEISRMSSLLCLALRRGCNFTSDGLVSAFSSSALMGLQHLDLSDCLAVDDAVVEVICNCCGPQLLTLFLNWCWSFSDVGLCNIVVSCRRLFHLSLMGNHVISGESLSRIPETQPLLKILNLTQCNRVDDAVIARVSEQMRDLYIFDYFGERIGGLGSPEDICQYDLQRAISKVPICRH